MLSLDQEYAERRSRVLDTGLYKRDAVPASDGTVSFDGLVLDGWKPA